MDEHHKMQRFLQKNDSEVQFYFSTESISDQPIFKLGDTEAVLEPKLMNSVGPSHSSVAPRLLGFHRVPESVTPISNSRLDRVSLVQWHKPNRWDRVFQLGGSEMVSAET